MNTAGSQGEHRVFGVRVLGLRSPRRLRLGRLAPGLMLFGVALALSIEAKLGVNPWTSFHQGAAEKLGVSVGTMVAITSAVLLLSFGPLREPIGIGTVLNVVAVGPFVDVALFLIPDTNSLVFRIPALLVSPALLGLATGLYLGSGLGPGPRDGIMTALVRRGLSISVARGGIELVALTAGWLLGGDIGVGTVLFALTVGWWVRLFLGRLTVDEPNSDHAV